MFFGSRLNRLATSIRRGISKYSVGSDNPGLVFDFIDNFYQKDKNQTVNFDGAITHARAGNATMTDGYGPELVTNGSFTDSIDGWSGAGWVWSSRGASYDSGSSVTVALSQDVAVEAGKTYIVTFTLIDVSGGTPSLMDGGQSLQSHSTSGNYEYAYIADSSTFELGFRGGTATFYVDSVSVREMPVLKWAPHNELTYSEDLTNGWGVQNGSVGSTGTTDPNGVTTNTTLFIPSATSSNQHRVIGNNTSISIPSYRLSFWLKPSGYTKVGFRNGVTAEYAAFSLVGAGTVIDTSNCTATIVQDGDWYFCSVERDNVSGIRADIYTFDNGYTSGNPNGYTYTGDATSGVYIWGAHVYRSDLGGMVDNPDRGDSYVPTTSSAKYLPRIGHHVYNGSAWVNEGVLAESESRANLIQYSDASSGWSASAGTLTANSGVSPDGSENASSFVEDNNSANHQIVEASISGLLANVDNTFSAYVKTLSGSRYAQLRIYGVGTNKGWASFDLSSGVLSGSGGTALKQSTIQNIGNGWYRVSITTNHTSTYGVSIVLADSGATEAPAYTGDSTSGIYFYGIQVEQGSTPSSLIPTSGSSVTREAESFTIPSANLPWPTPVVIGDELVANGTFDTDISGWTTSSADWTWDSGSERAYLNTTTNYQSLSYDTDYTSGGMQAGQLYLVEFDYELVSGSFRFALEASNAYSTIISTLGSSRFSLVITRPTDNRTDKIQIRNQTATTELYLDNVSIKEINPLSVSIGMEGRVTFANTWTSGTKQVARFFRWQIDNDNKLVLKADSTDASGERLTSTHEVNNVADFATFNDFVYEGVLQSVNVALRVGSTFFQVAADGQTGGENATLTSLVDLSATDLDLVDDDYMGTVSEFRIWDKDIGDAGLVEATNPSLEPSLSLTFEGVGTNSFVVNDWAE